MAEIIPATNLDRFDIFDAKYKPGNLYHTYMYAKQCLCILESVTIELVLLQFYHATVKLRSLGFCYSRRNSSNSRSAMHICVIFQKTDLNASVHYNQMFSGNLIV